MHLDQQRQVMSNAVAAEQAADMHRNVSAHQAALVNAHYESIQMARDAEFSKSALYPDVGNSAYQSSQARQA